MNPATVLQNVDVEEALVASVLVAPDHLTAVRERVEPGDFHDLPCRTVYEAACRVADRGEHVGQVAVAEELSRRPHGANGTSRAALDEVGGPGWLSKIVADLPTPIGCEYYADIVHRHATFRHLISAAGQIADMARQGGLEVDEVVRRSEALIAGVRGGTKADAEPFAATSLDELLAGNDDETEGEVIISDGGEGSVLARDGKMAVAAATGVGKTNLIMGVISRSLVEAKPFLGLDVPKPQTVLFVALEGSTRNLRRRLRKVWAGSGAAVRERFTLAKLDRLDLMDPAQLSRFDALIAEVRPTVLIIDALRYAHNLDENDNTAMSLLTAVLDGIIARHHCALIVAHHDRKRPPFTKRDTGTDRVRGATAFTGWLTSCLSLDRDPSGTDRFLLEWTKTRDAEEALQPLALDFDRTTLSFTIAERNADGAVSADTILTAVWRDGGSVRGPDLIRGFVDGMGARERSVRDAVRALVKAGRLVEFIADEDQKAGAKSYRLPDEGPEEAQS